MRRDVKEWCRKCDRCAMRKTPKRKPRSALKQYNVGLPLERVGIDIIGPVVQSNFGNKYILTICDYFTKFVVAVPMKNQEARTVARTLRPICLNIRYTTAAAFRSRHEFRICSVQRDVCVTRN